MCRHCEEGWPVDYLQADVPAMDVQMTVEDVEIVPSGRKLAHLVVCNQISDDEARFKIKYCPMCGRRLKGERKCATD